MTSNMQRAAPLVVLQQHRSPARVPLHLTIPLACVFGACMTLSFAPAYAWWFTPFCIAGLLSLLIDKGPLGSSITGFSFGIGWFATGFWWITPGLNNFSEAGPLLSFALTVALVVYMAVFAAAASAGVSVLQPKRKHRFCRLVQCLTAASCWTLAEWIRGHLFGGLPWLTTGYSQVPGPMATFAPIVGVYGLTFITAFLAATLACWISLVGAGQSWMRGLAIPFAAVLIFAAGGYLLGKIEWTQDTGRKLTVRLLQGNLPQHDKFTIEGLRRSLSIYSEMLQTTTADLTALPETALPIEWKSLPSELRQAWQDFALERKTAIVIGTVASSRSADGASVDMTNSAIALAPGGGGKADYQYDKQRLVPFGEAIPNGAGWLGRKLNLDFGSFTPGRSDQPPLMLPNAKVAISICFEDLFDVEIADKAEKSDVILNISNFAWFSHTYAPAQHLQVAQLRALETGRWVIHASNTGTTALIDRHGVVREALAPNITGYLDGQADLFEGSTPFMVARNRPLMAALLLFILIAAYYRFRQDSAPKLEQLPVTSNNNDIRLPT